MHDDVGQKKNDIIFKILAFYTNKHISYFSIYELLVVFIIISCGEEMIGNINPVIKSSEYSLVRVIMRTLKLFNNQTRPNIVYDS